MTKKTTCIIVDDEPLAIKLITRHVEQMQDLELVASFQNPLEAFAFLKTNAVDLVFLDIQMPVLTGIDFVKSLRNPPGVIFTTAYRNYAVESYELNVIDYLVKPITFTRFFTAVNKFLNRNLTLVENPNNINTSGNQKDYIYVNANKKHIKVAFKDVLYIESIKDYVRIHLEKERVITKHTMSDFAAKLPNSFLRIHRSFIVNKEKLTAFTSHDVEIGEREIPIGGSYKKAIMEVLGKG